MSSESDFDIEDSDKDSVEVVPKSTSSANGKRASTTHTPRDTKKKKKTEMSDDDDFDQADDSDDEGASDVEEKAVSRKKGGPVKTLTPKKAVPKKASAPASNQRASLKAEESGVKKEIAATSSSSSSSSLSSSSSAAAVSSSGGRSIGDITRGPNITTESAAKKLILQYLKLQNRPYSAIQVFDNLHKRIAKPTVERCLTTLSETDGGLRCKEYGKAKIYFFDQLKMSAELSPTELNALDQSIKDIKNHFEKAMAEERRLRSVLSATQSEPTDADLGRMTKELEVRVNEKKDRVEAVGSTVLPPNALRDAIKAHNFFRGTWRSRKDALVEVVDAISDGMEKKSSVVMAGMGIETDGDVSAVMPAVIPDVI